MRHIGNNKFSAENFAENNSFSDVWLKLDLSGDPKVGKTFAQNI